MCAFNAERDAAITAPLMIDDNGLATNLIHYLSFNQSTQDAVVVHHLQRHICVEQEPNYAKNNSSQFADHRVARHHKRTGSEQLW